MVPWYIVYYPDCVKSILYLHYWVIQFVEFHLLYYNEFIMNTFGEKLKKAREDKSLALKEAADGIGLKSLSTLSSYELNYRMPGIRTLIKIAKFYDVSLDYLLGINKVSYVNKDKVLKELGILKNKIIELEKYIENKK